MGVRRLRPRGTADGLRVTRRVGGGVACCSRARVTWALRLRAREERVMTVTDPGTAGHAQARMRVRKRNGDAEPVDVNKIVRAVERCAGGLTEVDPLRVATRTISGLYDGASTAEL